MTVMPSKSWSRRIYETVEHNSLIINNLPVTKSTNIGLRTNTNPLLFASLLNHKNLKRCQKKSNY